MAEYRIDYRSANADHPFAYGRHVKDLATAFDQVARDTAFEVIHKISESLDSEEDEWPEVHPFSPESTYLAKPTGLFSDWGSDTQSV